MTDVVIAGIAQTPVGEHWEKSLRGLGVEVIRAALVDAGGLRPQALYVGNMLAPNLSRQAHLGVLLADFAGLAGIEAASVEASGAGGAAALRQGYMAVKSGMVDVAVVVGVEKFTDVVGPEVEEALATSTDSDYEAIQGVTPAAQAALLMQRYIYEYNVPANGLAGFVLNAHLNAVGNKYAMYRNAIKPETYANAEMVCTPVNMLDAAPYADGAAAVVLTRRELLPSNHPYPVVKIAGSAIASDTLALHDRHDFLAFAAAGVSTEEALRKAGVTLEQINFFEYHDSYSIYAALSLEAAGFAVRGEGWKFAQNGKITLNGQIPCATMGGLKARGNPGGASGVYQAVEATIQLRGNANPSIQLNGATLGMIQSLGGPASVAVTHILQKVN